MTNISLKQKCPTLTDSGLVDLLIVIRFVCSVHSANETSTHTHTHTHTQSFPVVSVRTNLEIISNQIHGKHFTAFTYWVRRIDPISEGAVTSIRIAIRNPFNSISVFTISQYKFGH